MVVRYAVRSERNLMRRKVGKINRNITRHFVRLFTCKPKLVFSLSTDYYIFAAIIILMAAISALASINNTSKMQLDNIKQQMVLEESFIERTLGDFFDYVERIAEDKGRKIAMRGPENLENIDYLFKRK